MTKDEALRLDELKHWLWYEPETGIFRWRYGTRNKTKKPWDVAGCKSNTGYVHITLKNKTYRAHRLAWMYIHNDFPKNFIDHINGIKSDNRICNIRDVTRSENMQNLFKPQGRNIYIGVYKNQNANTWYSKIEINGKQIRLGTFKTPEEANIAYKKAKLIYHPTAPCR